MRTCTHAGFCYHQSSTGNHSPLGFALQSLSVLNTLCRWWEWKKHALTPNTHIEDVVLLDDREPKMAKVTPAATGNIIFHLTSIQNDKRHNGREWQAATKQTEMWKNGKCCETVNACLCTRGLDSAFFTDDGWFLFAYAEGRYKDD